MKLGFADVVSGVDSIAEVRFTLHMIVWRQEPNSCRQRQIRFWADPFDIDETRCPSRVSGVDSIAEVRFTIHMIVCCREPNRCPQRQIRFWADPYDFDETRYPECSFRRRFHC